MRKSFAFLSVLLALLWAVFTHAGCSANSRASGSDGAGGDGGDDTSSGSGQGGAGGCLFGCSGSGGSGGGVAGVIDINPKNVTLQVVDATIPTQVFTATFNGQDITAQVLWTYERPDIGDVLPGATFTPTGNVGGVGKLVAKYSMAEGNTDVTVSVSKTVGVGSVTPEQKNELDNPTLGPDPAMQLLYPYDKTVFPLAVLAPEMQWNGGNSGDVYRLHLKEKHYEYTEYFTAAPPAKHVLTESEWTYLGSSGAGAQSDPVTVELTRLSGAQAFQPVVNTWHIAQGRLKGSVYYWELPDQCGVGNGRILRIKPDSPNVDEFYQPGVCWGCHTVSRDGKTMMATLETGSPFPLVTVDLTQDPAIQGPINQGHGLGGTFSAFNNDSSKIVYSTDGAGAQLNIVDALTGQMLAPSVMGNMCGEPAWSPDGTKMAAICNLSSYGWIFDAYGGDLAVSDVAADGITVSPPQTIVPQGGGQGRPAYPSFSPGSEWIAFGRPTSGSRSTGNGDLWIVGPDGQNLKKLQTASSDNQSFNPVFAPLRAGGYFWLVFVSRRNYGNTLVGANRQQLWITAIDDPPSAADPSHPPFYLRGQENCGKSENAYYALDPCKPVGAGCQSGVDCCDGQCVKDNMGQFVCGKPGDPGQCSQDGNKCVTSADCCNKPTSKCVDGFCEAPIPQ